MPARRRGQGSTVGRPVGLGLDAGSERRRVLCPGNPGCGSACSPTSDVDVSEAGVPVAVHSFAAGRGWHGVLRRSQTGSLTSGRPRHRVGGGQNGHDLACWLRRAGVHAGRAHRTRPCSFIAPRGAARRRPFLDKYQSVVACRGSSSVTGGSMYRM